MITDFLAYLPSPPRGVWYLGPIPLRAYALCIVAGILVALWLGDRRWVARGGQRGVVYDVALWAVPFGLIGGRLYHLMTDWPEYVKPGGPGWAGMWRIWDGGLGIWGAVALGGVGAWIACRRRGIPLPAFGDAVAPGIILAQAIGRVGNYFNQELYGRETDVPWGLEIFNRGPNGCWGAQPFDGVSTGDVCAVVHPTFLYELLWNLVVFAVLIYVDRRFRIGHGRLFALYVAGYCIGRFGVELLRADHASMPIADIRINSFTAAFVFIGAVVYMVLAPKGREDPATPGGAESEQTDEEHAAELVTAGAAAGAAQPEPAVDTGTGTAEPADSAATPAPEVPEVEAAQPDETEAQPEAQPEPEPEPADESVPTEAAPESEPDDTVSGEAPEPETEAAETAVSEAESAEPATQDDDTEAEGEVPPESVVEAEPGEEPEPKTEPDADTVETEPVEPVTEDSDDTQEAEPSESEPESKLDDAGKPAESSPQPEDSDDTDDAGKSPRQG